MKTYTKFASICCICWSVFNITYFSTILDIRSIGYIVGTVLHLFVIWMFTSFLIKDE